MNCVFCKILKGELPSHKVYEDEQVFCFLDVAPINLGHSLLIPKEHHTSLTTVPKPILCAMFTVAPLIAQMIVRVVDADGFNLHLANGQCAGQVVPHAHLHIIPRSPTDGFTWGWRSKNYADEDQKSELVRKVVSRLDKISQINNP